MQLRPMTTSGNTPNVMDGVTRDSQDSTGRGDGTDASTALDLTTSCGSLVTDSGETELRRSENIRAVEDSQPPGGNLYDGRESVRQAKTTHRLSSPFIRQALQRENNIWSFSDSVSKLYLATPETDDKSLSHGVDKSGLDCHFDDLQNRGRSIEDFPEKRGVSLEEHNTSYLYDARAYSLIHPVVYDNTLKTKQIDSNNNQSDNNYVKQSTYSERNNKLRVIAENGSQLNHDVRKKDETGEIVHADQLQNSNMYNTISSGVFPIVWTPLSIHGGLALFPAAYSLQHLYTSPQYPNSLNFLPILKNDLNSVNNDPKALCYRHIDFDSLSPTKGDIYRNPYLGKPEVVQNVELLLSEIEYLQHLPERCDSAYGSLDQEVALVNQMDMCASSDNDLDDDDEEMMMTETMMAENVAIESAPGLRGVEGCRGFRPENPIANVLDTGDTELFVPLLTDVFQSSCSRS